MLSRHRLPRIPHVRIPFFRIFYSGTFTFFTLVLTGLLLIMLGDHISQSFHSGQLYHIIVVAAVYILTSVAAVFIYARRLFTTRRALAGIPKEWNLAGDEGKNWPGIGLGMRRKVGRVVREGLERSAIVSFESRPRQLTGDSAKQTIKDGSSKVNGEKETSAEVKKEEIVPIWGVVRHRGWASPESSDLPNLHFQPVIAELGHLIEAKAVSMAPIDPTWQPTNLTDQVCEHEEAQEQQDLQVPTPDPVVVRNLQRPAAMGLRQYVAHLCQFGMIRPARLGTEFIVLYERARFSGIPLQEEDFRTLMGVFAELLRSIQPVSDRLVAEFREAAVVVEPDHTNLPSFADDTHDTDGDRQSVDREDDAASISTSNTIKHTPLPPEPITIWSRSGSEDYEAPRPTYSSRSFSAASLASSHPSRGAANRLNSHTSLASISTMSDAGSVIRLADAAVDSADLPYCFVTRSREGRSVV